MLNWFIIKVLFLCNLFALLSTGCSNSNKDKASTMHQGGLSKKSTLHLTASKNQKWLKESLNVQENIYANNALGINLTLDLDVNRFWLDSVKNLGYDGVYINFVCLKDGVKKYESRSDLSFKNRINTNKGMFVSAARKCTYIYHFPYKDLQLHEGNHELSFGYSLHGVNFQKEKEAQATMFVIKKIDTARIASSIYTTKATSPCLYKVSITVSKFELETINHDIHNYDFSLGGSGMPDLYWDIFCGEKLTYCAPQIKNTSIYNSTHASDYFYCCQDDMITINFADYDNGPFNTQDDLIASWQGKIADLPIQNYDTLHYDKMKYALFKASVVK